MSNKKKNNTNNTNNNPPRKTLPQSDLSTKRREIFDLKADKKKTKH